MIYFIRRGPRPDYHRAPFHPFIICDRKPMAKWEADCTGERAWVWSHEPKRSQGGWLLERWEGLDIDYGHVVRCFVLPDGTKTGFFHLHADLGYDTPGVPSAKFLGYAEEINQPWCNLSGAIWWSSRVMPKWLQEYGVLYPPDDFTQQCILDDEANLGNGSGVSGAGRKIPAHWTQDPDHEVRDGAETARWEGFVGAIQDTIERVDRNIVVTEVGGTNFVQALEETHGNHPAR